jgi:hypothetical protein
MTQPSRTDDVTPFPPQPSEEAILSSDPFLVVSARLRGTLMALAGLVAGLIAPFTALVAGMLTIDAIAQGREFVTALAFTGGSIVMWLPAVLLFGYIDEYRVLPGESRLRSRRLRLSDRRYFAALAELDRQEGGWRPRENVPHPPGRDDTHDRWLLRGQATDQYITIWLEQWRCTDRVWHRHTVLRDTERTYDSSDSEPFNTRLSECAETLRAQARDLEEAAQARLAATRSHAREQMLNEREEQTLKVQSARSNSDLLTHITRPI